MIAALVDLVIVFVLVAIVVGIPCYPLYQMWSLERKSKRQKDEDEKARTLSEKDRCLDDLLKEQKGRVNLTQFVIESNLPPAEAKQHLELRAAELDAEVEVDDVGRVFDQFTI